MTKSVKPLLNSPVDVGDAHVSEWRLRQAHAALRESRRLTRNPQRSNRNSKGKTMDPNANLHEQREIIARVQQRASTLGYDPVQDSLDLDRLAELAQALDEWLCGGGFLPDAWGGRQNAGGHASHAQHASYTQRTGRAKR